MDRLTLVVVVLLLGAASISAQACTAYTAGDAKWSTTPAFSGLVDGASVNITTLVWLDTTTPILNNVDIQTGGRLHFLPGTTPKLRAMQIYIRTGAELVAGCPSVPYADQAEIILYTKFSDYPGGLPPAPGVKVINVNGGTLQLYTNTPGPTWTVLSATADYNTAAPAGTGGASSITVADAVQWPVGSKIVIASSDFNAALSEIRTVTSVSPDGHTIGLDTPLQYMHWGKIWTGPNGDYVDERAEVGVLTRNLKIHGDITDGESGLPWVSFGGQVFINPGSSVQISGVELFDMGQAGQLARYPIHFHQAYDMTGSIIEKNAIHDTFQRCLTIHGTHNVIVRDNVAYNSSGHCYFIEDAVEHGNVYTHNLGVIARQPCCAQNGVYVVNGTGVNVDLRLLATDEEPAIFWITFPDNDFYNNTAVGGTFGFWYSLPAAPIGLNYVDPLATKQLIYPQLTPSGAFWGNKAHSQTSDGLFIDRGIQQNPPCPGLPKEQCGAAPKNTPYSPQMNVASIPGSLTTTAAVLDWISSQPTQFSVFEEFTAHHVANVGMWGRGNGIVALRAHLADNQISAQFPGSANLMLDSVFVGETDNIGNPGREGPGYPSAQALQGRTRPVTYDPAASIIGWRHYDSGGPDFGSGNRFHNYQMFFFEFDFAIRYAGAIGAQGGPNVITARTKFYNSQFFNTSDQCRIHVESGHDNALHGWAMPDADGTLTGGLTGVTIGGCGSWVVANNNSVARYPNCQYQWGWNSWICPGDGGGPARRHFSIGDFSNSISLPIENDWGPGVSLLGVITRLSDGANTTVEPKIEAPLAPNGAYPLGGNTVAFYYQNNLPMQEEYLLTMGGGYTPAMFTTSIIGMTAGNYELGTWGEPEWARVAIPFPAGTTFRITTNYNNQPVLPASSRAAMTGPSYYVEPVSNASIPVVLLWLHFQPSPTEYYNYYNSSFITTDQNTFYTVNASCLAASCTVPVFVPIPTPTPAAQLPVKPPSRICETGGQYSQGALSYSLSGSQHTIFDNTWGTGWAVPSWVNNWNTTDTLPAGSVPPGTQGTALVLTWTPYQSINVRINGGLPLGGLTHLRFDVRMAAGMGPAALWADVTDTTGKQLGISVNTNNPWSLSGGPAPDDTKWTTVYVALADIFGRATTASDVIGGIDIGQSQGRNTTTFLDNISLGTYTTNLVSAPAALPTGSATVTGAYGTSSGPAGKPFPSGVVPGISTTGLAPTGNGQPATTNTGGGSTSAAIGLSPIAFLPLALVIVLLL